MVQFSTIELILHKDILGLVGIEYDYEVLLAFSKIVPMCESERVLQDKILTLRKRVDRKDNIKLDLELQKIIIDWYCS